MTARRLGILGGTFDPVHYGHLDAGDAAQRALGLDEVRLIPAHDPPHRSIEPRASAFHRFALVALAIDGRPGWRVSDAEVSRQGPSYTVDTLRGLRGEGWLPSQVFFILGADAFAEIATWHEFPAVLDEAHFVVVARPGTTLDAAVARTPVVHQRVRAATAQLARAGDHAIVLVEAATRDVSSTSVRARVAAGQPIDDLVPAAVARHIVSHQLYKARPRGPGDTQERRTRSAVDDLHDEEQRTHR
jgi:nicotinate-nucleotide adenylyltransferase